jgi:putative DNA primase/helicase
MTPSDKEGAAPLERDGLDSTQTEHTVEQEHTTKGEWDLDYELDQVAEIASPLEQERELQRIKKKSGESIDALRRELRHRRKQKSTEDPGSVPLVPDEPDPTGAPVEGIRLAENLATEIARYLVLPNDGELIIAMWVLFAHTFEAFIHAPYLAAISPIKGCGKSAVLDVVERLVPKPLKAEGFSAAAIYRTIEKCQPTLLIDELDAFIKGNDKLRGVLNSGYQQGGQYVCVVGDDHEPQAFSTWGPKVLAMIGDLPPTIEDRSIVIRMERKLASEQAESLTPSSKGTLLELKRRCIRWAEDHRENLRDREPEMESFRNRQADRWRPLFAIAGEVGGPWPDMLRGAAEMLESRAERSYAVDLLSHIWEIFDTADDSVLSSQTIVDHLVALPEAPWSEWSKGKPMTRHALAKMLNPFGIKSERSRVGTRNPVSVYGRKSFEPVWERYLPSRGLRQTDTTGTSRTNPDSVPDVPVVSDDLCLPGMEVDREDG